MIQKIGLVIMAIGASAADSDCMWIPVALVAIGLAMMIKGKEGSGK